MGGKGSSSKRKPSKRKRDKKSSQKKSRRKESKKRRHNRDSDSSYSDDDSLNSEHSSPSTSGSDHRRRISKIKKRRRDYSVSSYPDNQSMSSDSDSLSNRNGFKRRKVRESRVGSKSTKRRPRKRSVSPKGNADAHRVRKRKRLGRNRVDKPIKKSSKKKPKKHLSGSSSSDSERCSTCQSSSSSSTADGKRRRSKKTLDKEIKGVRDRESKKPHKKRKGRSPSVRGSGQSVSFSHGDGAFSPVNNFRRLRSVIAVVDQPHDEGENRWERDPQKEEIVYDQNDYPSPKSVDSNEGGSKMESVIHSHDASSKRICTENFAGEEVTELTKLRTDESDRKNSGNYRSEGVHMNDIEKEKETDVSVPVDALGGDVLESILRQKALENLKKFQGRLQTGPRNTDPKKNNDTHVNSSSAGRVDIVLNKSTEQGSSKAREMGQISVLSLKSDHSQSTEVKKLPDSEHIEKESGMIEQTIVHPPNEDKCSNSHAILAECVSSIDNGPVAGTTNACSSSTSVEPSSSAGLMPGEHSLEETGEAKDGSEFEQKTMSVMRGGEMVRVSYKVYIPKKALARRQLRR